MNVCVTGGTGFVGSVLVPELVKRHGAGAVTALVLPGDRLPASWAGSGVRVLEGDLAEPGSLVSAVERGGTVVHLAGFISYARRDADKLERVNVDGTARVVEACLGAGARRLVHVSSVGAIGFRSDGTPADETTPFNWPADIPYMVSKRRGHDLVERAVREAGLRAVILCPASIMGPGDHDRRTPHNQLYARISRGGFFGSFAGGLAIVDVRDLVALILAALEGKGRDGESYLAVGANLPYAEVVRKIGAACGRRTWPFPVPAGLLTAAGTLLEAAAGTSGRPPLITGAYGRLSGWTAYYDGSRSRSEFEHEYFDVDATIRDGWEYHRAAFGRRETGRPASDIG